MLLGGHSRVDGGGGDGVVAGSFVGVFGKEATGSQSYTGCGEIRHLFPPQWINRSINTFL